MGWVLPIGFVLLAVLLVFGSRAPNIPVAAPVSFDRELLKVGPRRVAMTDPARIRVEGFEQACDGCHQIFKPTGAAGRVRNYHQDIQLNHGLNNRCVNCHDAGDLERLTLRDGSTVRFSETPRLCAQCHGTVYRDWQRGTHGKTLGSWITGSQAQRRLSCNECHNPHSPRYDPYPPLPGPNTLRMGDQQERPTHDDGQKPSPLQTWLRGLGAASHPGSGGPP